MAAQPDITLVGCGKMGSAMLRGWLDRSIVNHVYIIEPMGLPPEFQQKREVTLTTSIPSSDIVILAVKPQVMKDVCALTKPGADIPVLSIAAGQKITNFETYFGASQPIIRAMPNTPTAIGQGITVCTANSHITAQHRVMAETLLAAVGDVVWINDESLMDAVTALSGSGPAYVFYLMEVLAAAGESCGLPADLARKLARQTVIGSAALAAHDSPATPETLRKNVTSPGGTTEAALNVLMQDDALKALFVKALSGATARSRELSS